MRPTGEQKAAITTLAPRLCVDAGAGSGKTRVLIERILYLIESNLARIEDIAAITFTEKAAAEMKERLRAAFHAKAPEGDPEVMSKWRDLERRVETARISTIHSFCGTMLREHALLLGVDPDFAVLTENESAVLRQQVVREAWHKLLDAGNASAHLLAVEMQARDLSRLFLSMLAQRHLIGRIERRGYPFGDPAALLTHWREIAQTEQARRIYDAAHSNATRRKRIRLEKLGHYCTDPAEPRNVRRRLTAEALDEAAKAESAQAAADALHPILGLPKDKASGKPWIDPDAFKETDGLVKKIVKWAETLLAPPAFDAETEARAAQLTCAAREAGRAIETAYAEAKRAANALDFDDLIADAATALRECAPFRERIAHGIRFLLIDEFQDTDETQLEIARRLAEEPGGPDLFIVGDAKQSIYHFRGAEVEVFLEERARAENVLPLSENFRTLPNVLAFINHFFSESCLLDHIAEYAPMTAHRDPAGAPCVEFLMGGDTDDKVLAEDYRREEAANIASRIADLCGGADALSVFDKETRQMRPATFGDVAILFRALSDVYLYEDALRRGGIPYVLASGGGFYERQEVTDVLDALRAALDPGDEIALLSFLRGPMASISDETLYRLTCGKGLAQGFVEPTEDPRLAQAQVLLNDLRAHREAPMHELVRRLFDLSGLEAILLGQPLGVQKAANVRKLLELAGEFARQRSGGLRAFCAFLRQAARQAVREGDATLHVAAGDAVTLLTIHKSKGLEFPIVFLAGMGNKPGDSRTPTLSLHRELGAALRVENREGRMTPAPIGHTINARIAGEQEAEQARLLYVAMTRARDYLVLCGRPNADTWYETLDDVYGFSSGAPHRTLEGKGWSALVRRQSASIPVPRARAEREAVHDFERYTGRIQPVPFSPARRNVFSISSILDYLSGHFDSEEERATEDRRRAPGGAAAYAMARGTAVHRLFECWDFANETPPDLESILAESEVSARDHVRLRESLQAIAGRFAASPLYGRLAGQSRLQREVPFLLRVNDALVSGVIDAVLDDGTLIDYKTGQPDPARQSRYEWQLLLYAAALGALTSLTPATGVLYYADTQTLHTVALDAQSIEWAMRHAEEAIASLRGSEGG